MLIFFLKYIKSTCPYIYSPSPNAPPRNIHCQHLGVHVSFQSCFSFPKSMTKLCILLGNLCSHLIYLEFMPGHDSLSISNLMAGQFTVPRIYSNFLNLRFLYFQAYNFSQLQIRPKVSILANKHLCILFRECSGSIMARQKTFDLHFPNCLPERSSQFTLLTRMYECAVSSASHLHWALITKNCSPLFSFAFHWLLLMLSIFYMTLVLCLVNCTFSSLILRYLPFIYRTSSGVKEKHTVIGQSHSISLSFISLLCS